LRGYSDRALLLLDGVARQNPELNVMVLGHGSPNGFLRRAFEAGADDIVMLPATPDRFA
jgi:DNA-binding NarL/FixJ family response regulator